MNWGQGFANGAGNAGEVKASANPISLQPYSIVIQHECMYSV